MTRAHRESGGSHNSRPTVRLSAVSLLLLVSSMTGGRVFAEARSPDDAPSTTAPSSTRETHLDQLRQLSPEEQSAEFIELGRRILADLEDADEPVIEAEIRCGIGAALRSSERFNEALIELRVASVLAQRHGQVDIQARSLADLARACFRLGEFDETLAACGEALEEPAIRDNPEVSWRFHNIMAAAQLQMGDYDDAIETSSHALERRQEAGDRHSQAILLNNIGVAHMYLGDNEQALEYFQRARVLKAELGESDGVADMLANIGDIRHLQGHSEQALEIHREALTLREAEGGELRIALSNRSLAAALHALDRNQEALDHIERALEIEKRLGLEPEMVTALAIKGEALAGLGRGEEAVAAATESLELARSMGMKSREVVALDALIEAYLATGDTDRALEAQGDAREIESELLTSEIRSDFAQFQAAFEAREREREIELLRKDNELQNLDLRLQRLWRNSLAIGVVLVTFIALAGWHRYLLKRREEHDRQRADTALLQSTERYRALFERNLAGVFQTDRNGRISITNRAFATMLGYGDADELGGKSIADLATESQEIERFLRDLTLRREIRNRELKMATRDGRTVTLLTNAGRIDDSDGDGVLIEGIAIDVSDRNRAEEDRRRLDLQLQQGQKLESLGVLAGGIAHDFNNMLMAILSNISLAKKSAAGSEKILRRLKEAEEVCLRATGLTQQLLTFSKGGRPIRKTAPIAGPIGEAAAFTARGSHCKIDFRAEDDIWPAEIDEGQVVQVIQNLVLNAIQAMPDGGTITVTADNAHLTEGDVPTLEAGRYVQVEVIDAGLGISDSHLDRIFDPFFTTKKGGSGLGLATAFSIVRSHGGAIVVRSEPDRGSKFTIYIPASDKPQVYTEEHTDDSAQGHGRLLIMDDDEAVRSAAAELLETVGYEVDTAADGSVAIDLYTQAIESDRPYDAVVLDLTVPEGIGGRETMTRLLEIDPRVKAIVSSGYSTDPVMANYREHGFSGVAVKPYRLAELTQTLKIAIGGESTP